MEGEKEQAFFCFHGRTLVGEVDVARRVDQVQHVLAAVLRLVQPVISREEEGQNECRECSMRQGSHVQGGCEIDGRSGNAQERMEARGSTHMRAALSLMVIPRSRSMSMLSRSWACLSTTINSLHVNNASS